MSTESYLALGRSGKSSWLRYLLGSFLIIGSLVLTQIGLVFLLHIMTGVNGKEGGYAFGVKPLLVIPALGLSFIIWLFCIWLIVRLVHKRTLLSFITPQKKLNYRRVFWGLGTWMCLNILVNIITWLVVPHSYKFSLQWREFFCFLPLVLLLSPIQCCAEEVFFRGYLLQGFSSFIKNGWSLAVANGLLFVIPYLCSPQSAREPVVLAYMISYVFTGCILALVTIRTNSLEAAIGMHMANNIFMALGVSNYESPIKTSPIFVRTACEPIFELPVFIISALIFCWLNIKFIRKQLVLETVKPAAN